MNTPESTQPQAVSPKPQRRVPDRSKRTLLLGLGLLGLCLLLVGAWRLYSNHTALSSYSKQARLTSHISVRDTAVIPATLRITPGTSVTWDNEGNATHTIAADPHPQHSSIPGFADNQPLTPGDSYTYVFEKVGTYHFHDEANPLKLTGTIIVEQQ